MRPVLFPLVLVALASFIGFARPAQGAPETAPENALPRYKLEVFQELVYAGSSGFKFSNGTHEATTRTTLWVTRKNDDGSWHIVAHSKNTFTQRGNDAGSTPPADKRLTLGEFDLQPDGTVLHPPEGYDGAALTAIFSKLPGNPAELKSGWKVEEGEGTDRYDYRVIQDSAATSTDWVFEKSDVGLFSQIYVTKNQSVIHFDVSRGLITKVKTETSQEYGFTGKGSGSVELKSVEIKDPIWMEQLVRETALLVTARKAIEKAMADKAPNVISDSPFAAAEEALRAGRKEAQLPLVVDMLENQEKRIGNLKSYLGESKQREDLVLNKPAADWSTTDIDGGKHTLADYRGKVVVLDFWYRGCGWCVKAMPQIKQVVDHFQNRPVAILGMNTDSNDNDARFVIKALSLNYPTLKGTDLPKKYGVQGFPTLVVIDRQGIVRQLHVGYSPTLRQEMIDTIEGLLKDEP